MTDRIERYISLPATRFALALLTLKRSLQFSDSSLKMGKVILKQVPFDFFSIKKFHLHDYE